MLPGDGSSREDETIFVPTGTKGLAIFYALHRDEKVYGEDVKSCNPDRWDSIQPGPWQLVAFRGGQRACLGEPKTLIEASYTLIRLAQTFRRVERRDDRVCEGDQRLTAKRVHGCIIALIPV